MNKYVCDKELAKQLYEKGIITDSEMWWLDFRHINKNTGVKNQGLLLCVKTKGKGYFSLELDRFPTRQDLAIKTPTFLPCELLEKMPRLIMLGSKNMYLNCAKDLNSQYVVVYESDDSCLYVANDSKLSNACAKMLLWLEKKGHLSD